MPEKHKKLLSRGTWCLWGQDFLFFPGKLYYCISVLFAANDDSIEMQAVGADLYYYNSLII